MIKNITSKVFFSAGNARIVIVSSMAHETGKIRLDDLNWNTKGAYKAIDAYHQSKLANLMHGAALARRLPPRSVHYHP